MLGAMYASVVGDMPLQKRAASCYWIQMTVLDGGASCSAVIIIRSTTSQIHDIALRSRSSVFASPSDQYAAPAYRDQPK